MEQELDYKTLKDLFKELEEASEEYINYGNSKEKAYGSGMLEVIEAIYRYCEKNKIALWK